MRELAARPPWPQAFGWLACVSGLLVPVLQGDGPGEHPRDRLRSSDHERVGSIGGLHGAAPGGVQVGPGWKGIMAESILGHYSSCGPEVLHRADASRRRQPLILGIYNMLYNCYNSTQ